MAIFFDEPFVAVKWGQPFDEVYKEALQAGAVEDDEDGTFVRALLPIEKTAKLYEVRVLAHLLNINRSGAA